MYSISYKEGFNRISYLQSEILEKAKNKGYLICEEYVGIDGNKYIDTRVDENRFEEEITEIKNLQSKIAYSPEILQCLEYGRQKISCQY